MSGALSQADLDALLGTFSASGAPAEASAHESAASSSSPPPKRYDFSHPNLLSREQTRTLRTLHEGYAQSLAKKLSTDLLTNLSASVVSLDHLTYAEFLMLLPSPTVLSVIEVPELDGNVAIELNPTIAFTFIDRLLGGTGTSIPKIRPLTVIEQGLMERVITKCCQELSAMWAPLVPLTFSLQSIEGNPELARVVEPNEMVVLIAFELRMNEVTGMLNLCLPYVVMEPALNRLSQGAASPRSGAHSPSGSRPAIESSLGACMVAVDVDLARVDISFGELLDLRMGDVLAFKPAGESGARASIQGVARLDGVPGLSRGQMAFQVVSAAFDGPHGEERRS
jgi:flagellar motor switch protein FliM